jgi:hypothetical protein
MLRRRQAELRDAPPLADVERLPGKAEVGELLAFNRSYRRHLEAAGPLNRDRAAPLRAALKETDALYQVWDAVHDARCEYYYVTVRRLALKRLRDAVGPARYAAGDLPPVVPLWRFRDVTP